MNLLNIFTSISNLDVEKPSFKMTYNVPENHQVKRSPTRDHGRQENKLKETRYCWDDFRNDGDDEDEDYDNDSEIMITTIIT